MTREWTTILRRGTVVFSAFAAAVAFNVLSQPADNALALLDEPSNGFSSAANATGHETDKTKPLELPARVTAKASAGHSRPSPVKPPKLGIDEIEKQARLQPPARPRTAKAPHVAPLAIRISEEKEAILTEASETPDSLAGRLTAGVKKDFGGEIASNASTTRGEEAVTAAVVGKAPVGPTGPDAAMAQVTPAIPEDHSAALAGSDLLVPIRTVQAITYTREQIESANSKGEEADPSAAVATDSSEVSASDSIPIPTPRPERPPDISGLFLRENESVIYELGPVQDLQTLPALMSFTN